MKIIYPEHGKADFASGAEVPPAQQPGQGTSCESRNSILFEMAAVLCIFYMPALFNAITACCLPSSIHNEPFSEWLYLLFSSLFALFPVFFIIRKSTLSFSELGIVKFDIMADVIYAGVIFVVIYCIRMIIYKDLGGGDSLAGSPELRYKGAIHILLGAVAITAMIANSFAEEIIIRAYLITRLKNIVSSGVLVVAIASTMFASYHIYQGHVGVLSAFATGIVYSIFFYLFKRTWPLIIAHTLHNVIVFI